MMVLMILLLLPTAAMEKFMGPESISDLLQKLYLHYSLVYTAGLPSEDYLVRGVPFNRPSQEEALIIPQQPPVYASIASGQESPGNFSFPVLLGELAFIFNLPEAKEIYLTPEALLGIYIGRVKRWKDLQDTNANISLPDREIRHIYRSNPSDINLLLTSTLTSFRYQETFDDLSSRDIPKIYASNNVAMLGTILTTADAVGYSLLSEALAFNASYMRLISSSNDTYLNKLAVFVNIKVPENNGNDDCGRLANIVGFVKWLAKSTEVSYYLPLGWNRLDRETAKSTEIALNDIMCDGEHITERVLLSRCDTDTTPVSPYVVALLILLAFGATILVLLYFKKGHLMRRRSYHATNKVDMSKRPRQESKLTELIAATKQSWIVPQKSIKRLMIEVNQVISRPVTASSQCQGEVELEVADLKSKAKFGTLNGEFVSAFESLLQKELSTYRDATGRKLDDFVFSITHENVMKFVDAVRGMEYLHSKDIVHGRLSSFTCYLDSKWTLKITDWAMNTVIAAEDPAGLSQISGCKLLSKRLRIMHDDYIRLLYTEPDIICAPGSERSWHNDVYSFGMLAIEIFTRKHPFYTEQAEGQTMEEIFRKVASSYIRPIVPESLLPTVKALISLCLREERSLRLTFTQIIKFLKDEKLTVNKGVVESIMEVMEEYMANLEEKVEERTKELQTVTEKMETLLCSILPRDVARKLQNNEIIEPEYYDFVSIYFSDIVGFTNISSESTPLQVVNFLNALYTYFDEIIDHFDVYKVETIGDAYMVVSGLPTRNGSLHASEISKMAIMLIRKGKDFVIPHRPDMPLQIRVGLNSGPVMAGVVGLKMPRYCLFGDAVNTASRMESTSLPLKIQATEHLIKFLKEFPGFKYDFRGNVEIKGKGTMDTYWILDHLPEESVMVNTDADSSIPETEARSVSQTKSNTEVIYNNFTNSGDSMVTELE